MELNNISGNIAFLRDTFLDAEKQYLVELMKQPKYKAFIEKLNQDSSKELSLEAIRRISPPRKDRNNSTLINKRSINRRNRKSWIRSLLYRPWSRCIPTISSRSSI